MLENNEKHYYEAINDNKYLKQRENFLKNTTTTYLKKINLLADKINELEQLKDIRIKDLEVKKAYQMELYYLIIKKDYETWKKTQTAPTSTD